MPVPVRKDVGTLSATEYLDLEAEGIDDRKSGVSACPDLAIVSLQQAVYIVVRKAVDNPVKPWLCRSASIP